VTVKQNTAEGGTNGTTVSTGNSGGVSGDAFFSVSPGTGGTITFTNAQAMHGTLSYNLTTGTTATTVILSDGNVGTSFGTRFYIRLTGYPSSETIIHDVQTAAGTTVSRLHITTTGALKVVNNAGTAVSTFTNVLALNTWYRVAFWGTVNATTGSLNAVTYAGDSLTAIETKNLTNQNTGSTGAGRAVYGKGTPSPTMATFYIDDIKQDLETAAEISIPTNSPPTVSVNSNQNVAAGATVNLTASASDSDGSIATYAWTYDFPTSGGPSITGGSTAAASFTAGSAGNLYVLRCTVTDNLGATAFDTTEVRVPTTTSINPVAAYPAINTTYVNTGGAANLGAALSDGSDTTYAESTALTSTEQEIRVRLDPATVRTSLSLTFRVSQDVAGTIVAKGRLYQGTTMLQEWTLTTTTSAADQVVSASGGTISSITDWGNLWAAVAGTA
jgi:hypothetical protein